MLDERMKKMANIIIDYSLNIQRGERVLIESSKNCIEMLKYMIEQISKKGAIPIVQLNESSIRASIISNGTQEQFEIMAKTQKFLLENIDVYINMLDSDNSYDIKSIPQNKRELYQKYYFKPINFGVIVPKKRWITVEYPSINSAIRFGMGTSEFEEYFFNAINIDYESLSQAMKPLKILLENTERIYLKSGYVDLHLLNGGHGAVVCDGKINFPDGEVFMAPKINSAQGRIKFNVPAKYMGNIFNDLELYFENGEVVKATTSSDQKKLDHILSIDEGCRKIGEFALGTNSKIRIPTGNIIFDEKICGSFHIALGASHHLSSNSNISSIHWDIVNMMTPEYGGGEIYFDNILIQKDGEFIMDELKDLNIVKKIGGLR